MDSLVIQLQREAVDGNVSVSSLLRKALVVARELGIAEFQKWIELELNGYPDGFEEFPDYRLVHGEVRAQQETGHWVPVLFRDSKSQHLASRRRSTQSVGELENMLESAGPDKGKGMFQMPFPPDAAKMLIGQPTPVAVFVPPAALVRTIDGVRNVVLNWALKLEENGILGEGFLFTAEEKKVVERKPEGITNHFYGPVTNSPIQQGGDHLVQLAHVQLDMTAVREAIALVRANLDNIELEPEQRQEAEAELATIEAQVRSPKPKEGIVRTSMKSLRTILERGGGTVVGHVLIELGKLMF